MKISLFSTNDAGGAGKAALRLNRSLNIAGENSTLFVKWKNAESANVMQLNSAEIVNRVFDKTVIKHFFNNVYEGNTICSAMYPSVGFNYLTLLRDTNIVNLHWISTFVSVEAIAKIHQMGKPIVWTLHDQNPMTGGCHYTHGCEKYKIDCSDCPQLKENQYNITKSMLETKIKYLPKDIIIVTPSRWMADCARESTVFRSNRIEVIPNSIETELYKPMSKTYAKMQLDIPVTAKVILFGAYDLKEKRKGLEQLIQAIQYLMQDTEGRKLIEDKQLYILTFGQPSTLLTQLGIPYKTLSYIHEDERLALAYSAADVLALPSLEDNLPNLILESMACGTPVVAFKTGGMPDIIKDGDNGFLVPLNDAKGFATQIMAVFSGPPMNDNCRRLIVDHYRLDIQASRYQQLFAEIAELTTKAPKQKHIPYIFAESASVMMPLLCETAVELQAEHDALKQECDALRQKQDMLITCKNNLEAELQGVYRSKSWKITKPLREVISAMRRFKQ
ncbi:glycosyltransferase [Acetonema longum]|uniref:Glycosyl transferase, group 1 n=1 Tax=Acetonema longum DSM 6540 TaxID=1009370 RepID=F7NNR0_9FIRM|nr:glycosyltransferase [Acetonema longum]EGO62244.1 glycosyl transferase, group 1 [Acetonema longum DSM 6540]